MERIKDSILKYPRITEATVITKTTAILIPVAVSTFLDTPKNGQIPKNLDRIKLLTKMALIKIRINSFIPHPFFKKLFEHKINRAISQ